MILTKLLIIALVIVIYWAIMLFAMAMGLLRARKRWQAERKLFKEALVWAVGTGRLPPTCPGHFMHLLIDAKQEVERLENK